MMRASFAILAAALLMAGAAFAQQSDYSKVEIRTTRVCGPA